MYLAPFLSLNVIAVEGVAPDEDIINARRLAPALFGELYIDVELTFDAWNRLTSTSSSNGISTRRSGYAYDAVGRSIGWFESTPMLTVDRVAFSDLSGRVIEERRGSTEVVAQYVWSGADDHLILRDRETAASGFLDERHFTVFDPEGSITALVSKTGEIVERYSYSPLGVATARKADWTVDNETPLPGDHDELLGRLTNKSGVAWTMLWRGQRLQRVPGLYNIGGSQYYDPRLARTIAPAPGAAAAAQNAYSFDQYWSAQPWTTRAARPIAVGSGMLMGGLAGLLAGNPLGGAAAGGMAVSGYLGADGRYVQGQGLGNSILGGIADGTGATQVFGAFHNQDIITGAELNWSTGERWFNGILGGMQVAGGFGVAAGALGKAGILGMPSFQWTGFLGGPSGAGAMAASISWPFRFAGWHAMSPALAGAVSAAGGATATAGLWGNELFMAATGRTASGIPRVSAAYRLSHRSGVLRQHHLVPQQLLKNPHFVARMRALGVNAQLYVNRQIALITNKVHKAIHPEWNYQWDLFLRSNPNFTLKDIQAQIRNLATIYDIPMSTRNFARAFRRN